MSKDQLITNIMLIAIIFMAYFFKGNRKKFRNVLIFSVLVLAFFAYHFMPAEGMDLSTHFIHLKNMRLSGWNYTYDQTEALPVYKAYLYLLSRFPNNYFFPAITCLLIYGPIFAMINSHGLETGISGTASFMMVCYIVIVLSYISSISNIRNPLATSLFCFASYMEIYSNKNKIVCWALMIAAALFHPAVALLFIIKIISMQYKKMNKYAVIGLLVLAPVLVQVIVPYLASHVGNIYLKYLLSKINLYIFEASEFKLNRYITAVFGYCVCILFYYIWKKKYYPNTVSAEKWSNLIACLMWVSLAFIGKYVMFLRLYNCLKILIIIPLGDSIGKYDMGRGAKITRYMFLVLIICCIFLYTHNFYSGYYYASKYWW